ncbi:MAG TPA: MYXO-CTERM sorting domain-containing protein [Kofleriaceae bacterium]|nr:MYXO-CTERM sorting domain-containing protein [Kofleriaceae bacterium]
MRRLAFAMLLVASAAARAGADTSDAECTCDVTPAACDAGCACDSECQVDWSVDECAAPDSGCLPTVTDPDEATLEQMEQAAPVVVDPPSWTTSLPDVACPDGATAQDGACILDPAALPAGADVQGGCASTGAPGLAIALAAIALVAIARRRRLGLALAIGACTVGGGTWDDAVDDGPTGDTTRYIDVYAADVADHAQFLLANQALAAGADQPAVAFSLDRAVGGVPVLRVAGACGDRLVTSPEPGAELLGWARAGDGDGTAALVELVAPDACTFSYETDPDEIAALIEQGYSVTAELGHVWPPALDDAPVVEPTSDAAPLATPTCHVTKHSAVEMMYASPGHDETLRFLLGCPGEVIVGEKGELGPASAMTEPMAHANGGRSAFVLDRNGDKLRALLARPNGVERTAAYVRHKLAEGYDYVAIDEVTAAPDYADGQSLNRRLRALLLRVPARTFIPYISIDLTQEAEGNIYMRDRRLLLRAFRRRARVLALEVYLQTPQVMAGEAPGVFRRAADRLADAVRGLADGPGINARTISTIGTSMHSTFPQYRYLDEPSHDLASITRQVNAIRHASKRTRQQHGVGWYFVDESDMAPSGHAYSYDELIRRMRTQALRFK